MTVAACCKGGSVETKGDQCQQSGLLTTGQVTIALLTIGQIIKGLTIHKSADIRSAETRCAD